jgi:GNAT superfamily N-acetyltransferase
MPAITYTQVATSEEVQQILALQALNHTTALDDAIMQAQGFVTVRHEPAVLQRMNDHFPSVIARCGTDLAGYCLVMPQEFAPEVPILAPMFDMLRRLNWQGRPLADYRWFVMGQVCVAEAYRGQGVFDGMYHHLDQVCAPHFDLVITEVALRNTRSLRAHERVGFLSMHEYSDTLSGEVWRVIGKAVTEQS